MAYDLSKLTDTELEAIGSGDMSGLSDSTLGYIASNGKSEYSQWAGDTSGRSVKDMQREFIMSQGSDRDRRKQRVKDVVPYLRPIVEGVGAVGGGMLGTVGGAATGGFTLPFVGAVPGAVAGGVAGSGLGYAAGKNIMDTLEGNWAQSPAEALTRAVTDVGTGAMYEMGGQVAAPVIAPVVRGAVNTAKFVKSPIKTTKQGWDNIAKSAAARRIASAASTEPTIAARSAANKAAYNEVQDAIPGYNLTPAQATDDPALLQLQQKLQFETTGAKTALEAQTMNNRQAVDQYLQQAIQTGTLDDFLKALNAQQQAKGSAVDTAIGNLTGAGKEAAGQTGREAAIAQRNALKSQADGLYGQVPKDMAMDSTPLYQRLQTLGDSVDPAFANPANMPSGTINRAKGALAPEPSPILGADGRPYNAMNMSADIPNDMTYGQLMQYNEQVTQGLRQAKAAGDFAKANNLSEIKAGIEQTLKLAESNGQGAGVDALRKANQFYRETYVPTVRQGATSKVLGTNSTGGYRVDDANVMGQYFRAGDDGIAAANSFNKTFSGTPEARKALLDYAKSDLETTLAAAPNQAKALNTWLAKHDNAINKLGMQTEFEGLKKALVDQADIAHLGKILDSTDPHQTMKALFQGANGRGSMQNILDLKKVVGNDPAALNGLKRSFADMMMNESQLAKQIGDDYLVSSAKLKSFWDKYEPAMQLLYTKDELKALQNARKAFDMENRGGRVISGVNGSQTRDIGDVANNAMAKLAQWDWRGRAVRFALDFAKLQKSERVKDYLVKAQFDPHFAKELEGIANAGKQRGQAAMEQAFTKAIGRYTAGSAIGLNSQQEQ